MTEDVGKAGPLPQLKKVDSEALVLRGRPRPVTRFRRSVVIGGMAALSMAVVTLTWVALEPTSLHRAVNGEPGRPFERAAPEAIANAPRDYRDVPLLGPPCLAISDAPLSSSRERLAAFQPGKSRPDPSLHSNVQRPNNSARPRSRPHKTRP
jgi:type IV secretion system protein VirB10